MQIFWSPLLLSGLLYLIFSAIIASYFIYKWVSSSRSIARLEVEPINAIFFGSLTVFIFFELLNFAISQDHALWLTLLSGLPGTVAASAYLLLIGCFYNTDKKITLIEKFIFCICTCTVIVELFIITQRIDLLKNGIVEYRENWVSIPIATIYLFAPFIAFYNLCRAIQKIEKCSNLDVIVIGIMHIFKENKPYNQKVIIARGFMHQMLFPIITGILTISRINGFIDWSTLYISSQVLMFLWTFHILLIYLNNTPEYFSFRIRIIGAMMAGAFFTFSGLAWMIGEGYVNNYTNNEWIENKTTISFNRNADSGYSINNEKFNFDTQIGEQIANLEDPVKLPFNFPFFTNSYSSVKVLMFGAVGFHEKFRYKDIQYRNNFHPAIYVYSQKFGTIENRQNRSSNQDYQIAVAQNKSGVFINSHKDYVTITWQNLIFENKHKSEYTFQLKLFSSGNIVMNYLNMPAHILDDIHSGIVKTILTGIAPEINRRVKSNYNLLTSLPYALQENEAVFQDWDLDFKIYLAKIYQPIVLFMLTSIFVLLFLVPRYFEKSVISPLQELLKGVSRVRNGDLVTPIKAVHKDEIGYLASAFNDMTIAQSELIKTLEKKVRIRSDKIAKTRSENAMLAERNRVSRELHDAVSQSLFSANLLADTLNDGTKRNAAETSGIIKNIRELNKDALKEMRLLLSQLRMGDTKPKLMKTALKGLIENKIEKHNTIIALEIENDVMLPALIHHMFFRVAQESINNALKHSKGNLIELYFDGNSNMAMLTIKDNGDGFDISQTMENSHGIQIMLDRAKEIGADLDIQSKVNNGTIITLIWYKHEE